MQRIKIDNVGHVNETVADRISKVRRTLRLTQQEFGTAAGVSKQAVSSWERGINEPERDALLSLKKSLKINTLYITSGEEPAFYDGSSRDADSMAPFEVKETGGRYLDEETQKKIFELVGARLRKLEAIENNISHQELPESTHELLDLWGKSDEQTREIVLKTLRAITGKAR